MKDIVIILIIAAIIGLAVLYIRKEKKSGKKCVGCPCAGSCSGSCSSCNLAENPEKTKKTEE